MATYQGADKADADSFLSLCNKLQSYPRKGVHIGGGIHVNMPDVYAPGAPGWTASTRTSPA